MSSSSSNQKDETYMRYFMKESGAIQNLKLQHLPLSTLPPLQKNQIRIRVKAIGLNFADVFSILGLYEAAPKKDLIPGLEFSGVVEETNYDDSFATNKRVQVGDRVYCVTKFNAFQSVVIMEAKYVRKIPADWSFEQGASFLVQALTAWYGIMELGHLKLLQRMKLPNEQVKVLVHSASGGVGLHAIQILNHFGAKTVATIGNASKIETLTQAPFSVPKEQIIVRTTASEFPQQVERALESLHSQEKSFDLVFDSLGGDYFSTGYQKLSKGGRLIFYGSGEFMQHENSVNWLKLAWKYLKRSKIDPFYMIGENKSVMGFNLIWLYEKEHFLNSIVDEMWEAMEWHAPVVGKTFDFETQTIDAIQYFQSGTSVGKVVLTVKE